jgi:dipeptidyl-peptidase 4
MVRNALLLIVLVFVVIPATVPAQTADSSLLTLDRVFSPGEPRGGGRRGGFGQSRWMDDGQGYMTFEPSANKKGRDLVRYETKTGKQSTLIPGERFVPAGATAPLWIENYQWSQDKKRFLIFTNSRRVWRTNTRGDFWVLTLADSSLKKLGGSAEPSSLMFAKFSPDGNRVAYVRANNLYVEDLATGAITQLTADGSRTIINGTSDWVYEEEFDVRDGFQWSPDGSRIAFWQFDASGVRDFYMINNTDSTYSTVIPVQYPKVGATLSACRVGAVSAKGGAIVWFQPAGDPRNNYIPRMSWAASSEEIVLQYMNRLQNTDQVMLGDVRSGQLRTILTERDSAWVDVVNHMYWLNKGKNFTWSSERDGWRHLYLYSRDGSTHRLLTPGDYDVIEVARLDTAHGWMYFVASPENPTQRYLYRARLDGKANVERVTPENVPGTHNYDISPDGRWAVHTYSRFTTPPITELIDLPDQEVVRVLSDGVQTREMLARFKKGEASFFRVDIGNGIQLDGWKMLPPDFDPSKRYPVLLDIYGEPAGQTVVDRFGGGVGYLWNLMLTQKGYIIMSIDNRGTAAPRGRTWRKCIYRQVGPLASEDQAAAMRQIFRWPYIDSTRIAVWGWSGGGSMTLNLMFRHPEIYNTGMAVAPVPDETLYDAVYQERYMGLLSDNAEGYKQSSPVTHAANLKGNLLLVHGTGDDNVHYQGSERLINALIKANKQFTMMAYPNRSHGIYEGEGTTRHLYGLLTGFLTSHMPAGPATQQGIAQ